MPAYQKGQAKKVQPVATKADRKEAKGLEKDEDLDGAIKAFQAKRSEQLLEDVVEGADNSLSASPTNKQTVAERRARRKQMQNNKGAYVPSPQQIAKMREQAEKEDADKKDTCPNCNGKNLRMMHWLPGNYVEGQYICQLCTKPGVASSGVWHCLDCTWNAHISCFLTNKNWARQTQAAVVADCPKPSLAWDPLSLTGPHMALGAAASQRCFGEVALD
jgi:ribosomal protein L37AE/L43A|uniref:Zinc finger PHD-type domain-containing protein n=1 Tax=Eutreptiella gymnastica TaxID=73025 RepID=A0A7S4GJV3_9EUGL|eukprot:CAMPEP_0174294530 /NCGR_PEP_ID=MMETSP0809-20121228/41923_1 /TAXON_ID=73025 ORGANISM="Eutreptiella gymnastica-like, Strain CCMP1594" /NCGR_SAMPLE_ID=MMETSP0809 /ASSEMBLY_ACC=CAM_ASM_000658 /LENGTH=217 /DNA_ID=CAMNT_0015396059 /DNA_START=31 /DNA_END=684 /DNA_ORIENTATION=+